jgi:hypothetical protein
MMAPNRNVAQYVGHTPDTTGKKATPKPRNGSKERVSRTRMSRNTDMTTTQ